MSASWCGRWDSNPHAFRQCCLRTSRRPLRHSRVPVRPSVRGPFHSAVHADSVANMCSTYADKRRTIGETALTGNQIRRRAYSQVMDDEALLERARRGDRDAFAALVTRNQDDLYTMALRMLGTPHDAADVVQETFLRAYTHLPELRGRTVRAWLFRVAVNCARDVQRRSIRRPASPLEDAEGKVIELPDPALGPEATALARQEAAAV